MVPGHTLPWEANEALPGSVSKPNFSTSAWASTFHFSSWSMRFLINCGSL